MRSRHAVHILDEVNFLFNPIGSPGPALLDEESRKTLFSIGATVTGEILGYGVIIAGTRRSWGYTGAMVGQEFEIPVECRYASSGGRHTRIDLTVWRPDGSSFSANDDDLWPYASPGETISFRIRGVAGEAFDINQEGTWEARLQYVWVE